jgi:hypothetical protein
MSDQLETMICILLAIMVCQGIQVIGQFFTYLAQLELHNELNRIANCLERMEK